MKCIECNNDFHPATPGQDTCVPCMIKPHPSTVRVKKLGEDLGIGPDPLSSLLEEKEPVMTTEPEKSCELCNQPYVPTSNRQKICPKCRSAEPGHDVVKSKVSPQKALDQVSSGEIESLAWQLMSLSGVRKMELCYDKFKLTIEKN